MCPWNTERDGRFPDPCDAASTPSDCMPLAATEPQAPLSPPPSSSDTSPSDSITMCRPRRRRFEIAAPLTQSRAILLPSLPPASRLCSLVRLVDMRPTSAALKSRRLPRTPSQPTICTSNLGLEFGSRVLGWPCCRLTLLIRVASRCRSPDKSCTRNHSSGAFALSLIHI